MSALSRRVTVAVLAVLAVPLVAALPIGPAQAATTTISVRSTTFVPSAVTLVLGSSVKYKNDTGVAVVLRSTTTNWSFTEPLAPGAVSAAHKPAVHGTFGASATGPTVSSSGVVYIVNPKPKPTATATSTASQTASPAPSPPPSTSSSPRPSTTTQPSVTPSGTHAPSPPSSPAITPSPTAASANTQPSFEGPPSPDPPALAGRSQRALIQSVRVRRLGLPGALSAVLVLGLLLGLGRVLLTIAPRRPQAD